MKDLVLIFCIPLTLFIGYGMGFRDGHNIAEENNKRE